MSSLNSRGFKWSLGSLASVVALMAASAPYFNLVSKVEAQDKEYKALRAKVETDHDILIQISSDIRYIKEFVKESRSKKQGN